MYNQTLCFIKRADELLMLNREKTPNLGLWNGVGGKSEQAESSIQCAIREIAEETGIQVASTDIVYKGAVTWIEEHQTTGMDLYLVEMAHDFTYDTPQKTAEGILDWKKFDWLMHPRNRGVNEMLQQFLPQLLNETTLFEHIYTYENGEMIHYEVKELLLR